MRTIIIMPLAEQQGGCEESLRHLIQTAAAPDVEWLVIFLEEGPLVDVIRRLGAKVHVVPAGRIREPGSFLHAVRRIAAIAHDEQADLLLSWMTKAHLYTGPAGFMSVIPTAWYQHGTGTGSLDRVATLLPARGVLACSGAAAHAQKRMWPRRQTFVVSAAVELDRFDPDALPTPAEARRRLGLPTTGPLIGIVGRLQRWKGMHVLLEAMPRILERHPNAHCVLVGGQHDLEADYPAYLKDRVHTLGLGDAVTLAGRRRNVPEWMQAMDVFVHASDNEPFGLVIIEAMALGKPVIAGGRGGPTEIITEGVDGLLSPFGDAPALADAVLHYLDDPAFAQATGAAARRRAQDFSTERYAANLIAAIRSLLAQESPASDANQPVSGMTVDMKQS